MLWEEFRERPIRGAEWNPGPVPTASAIVRARLRLGTDPLASLLQELSHARSNGELTLLTSGEGDGPVRTENSVEEKVFLIGHVVGPEAGTSVDSYGSGLLCFRSRNPLLVEQEIYAYRCIRVLVSSGHSAL
ncbi:hypothetical protein GCM10010439_14730 [Actinocorallia aurantiaca]|uniref:Uncharacterized protein n=1 Tax=Actinocorallia aurantiaca TaxID=46204 RepID=A0ABN3U0B1_9ACTN